MKRAIVKEVICSNKIDVLVIQETKLSSVHDSLVKEVWVLLLPSGAVAMQLDQWVAF